MYLDVVRFLAALVVFLGHASGRNWTGGLLWQTGLYGDTCVMIFFVLSGFVIAYVAEVKERTWQPYAASRAARLWSVAIPALALTLVIDLVGVQAAPHLYIGQPWYLGDKLPLRYIATFFMLQEVWHAELTPGINIPFWSLGFEAFYYLLFGVLLFAKGRARWGAVLVASLIAGPMIMVMFPVWLLGVLAYRWCKGGGVSPFASLLLFGLGLAVLACSPLIRSTLPQAPEMLSKALIGRYVDALAFFANLVGAYGLMRSSDAYLPAVRKFATIIAATTFPLYLFHRPLLQFFSYAGPEDASSWQRRVLVIAGTLAVVFVATPMCDRFKRFLYRETMNRIGGASAVSVARH